MSVQPDHVPSEPLALRLPAREASVPIARRAAVQYAEDAGAGDEALWRVRLAVSEALTNVVLHAYRGEDEPDADDGLVLTAFEEGERVVIQVADRGSGLQPRHDSPGMGFGLSLIAQSCEELRLDTDASGGTVVRMVFAR